MTDHMIFVSYREEFRDLGDADKVEKIVRGMSALKREVSLFPW